MINPRAVTATPADLLAQLTALSLADSVVLYILPNTRTVKANTIETVYIIVYWERTREAQ